MYKELKYATKIGITIIFSIFIAIVATIIGPYINIKLNALAVIAIVYYIGLISIFMLNPKVRWKLIPFILLTVPPNIDDIFPSTYIGYSYEMGATLIPIFGNIDISLLLLYAILKNENKLFGSKNKESHKSIRILKIISLILIALSILSAVKALNNSNAFQYAAIIKGTIVFFRMYFIQQIVSLLFNSNKNVDDFVEGTSLSSALLLVMALYNTLSKGLDRLQGSIGMNVYGNFMVLITILSFAFFINNKNKRKRKIYILGMFVSVIQLLLTGTRMAVLALGIGMVIYLLLSSIKFINKLRIIVSAAVIAGLGSILSFEYFGNALERIISMVQYKQYLEQVDLSTATTLGTRLMIWNGTVSMIKEHLLLGVGPSMWNFLRYNYGVTFNVLLDPHNGYLLILSEYGILVFITYVIYLYYCLSSGINCVKDSKGTKEYNRLLGIVLSVVAWLFTEFTNAGIAKPQIQVFIWAMFTIMVIYYKNNHGKIRT